MASLTDKKLAYLAETKRLIREAIVAKGQTVSVNDTFRSYAEKIMAISSTKQKIKFQYRTTVTPNEGDWFYSATSDISPDGRYLLCRSNSTKVMDVFDLTTNTVAWTVKDENGEPIATSAHMKFDRTGEAVWGVRDSADTKVKEVYKATANSFEVVTTYTEATAAGVFLPTCIACAPDRDEVYIFYMVNVGNYVLENRSLMYIDGEWKANTFTIDIPNGVHVTNDGVYAVAYGNTIQRFDRRTGVPFADPLDPPGTINNMTLTADNNYVVETRGGKAANGEAIPILSIYRVSDYEELYDFQNYFTELGFSYCVPGTNVIVFAYQQETTVRVFDTSSGSPVEIVEAITPQTDWGSNDGVMCSYSGNRVVIKHGSGYEVWDVLPAES